MNFTYLTDTSEKSLAPFLSPVILAALFKGLVIVSGVLLFWWPWKMNLAAFLSSGKTPLLFFVVSTTTLIVHAYLQLRCGRGELVEPKYLLPEYGADKKVVTFEQEQPFLRYGLVEFAFHVPGLLLPFFPLLILAASVSSVSLTACLQACSVILTTSLACRLFAFMIHLVWGRTGVFGYLLTRIFWYVLLFVTTFLLPVINPILILYTLNTSADNDLLNDIVRESNYSLYRLGISSMTVYMVYMGLVLTGIVMLVIIIRLVQKRSAVFHKCT